MRHMYAAENGLCYTIVSCHFSVGRYYQIQACAICPCMYGSCHLCRSLCGIPHCLSGPENFHGRMCASAAVCQMAWTLCCRGEGTPDSMENVVPGMRIKELSPPVRAQQAQPAQQALERQAAPGPMQPARVVQGFTPGNEGSHGILKKAQASTQC